MTEQKLAHLGYIDEAPFLHNSRQARGCNPGPTGPDGRKVLSTPVRVNDDYGLHGTPSVRVTLEDPSSVLDVPLRDYQIKVMKDRSQRKCVAVDLSNPIFLCGRALRINYESVNKVWAAEQDKFCPQPQDRALLKRRRKAQKKARKQCRS